MVYYFLIYYDTKDLYHEKRTMDGLLKEENINFNYQPKEAPYFCPDRIVLTKGSDKGKWQRDFMGAVCNLYPDAEIIERFDISHNRFELSGASPLDLHYKGKKRWCLENTKVLFDSVMRKVIPVQTIGIFQFMVFAHMIVNIVIWQERRG